jgi:plastocyanin
MEPGLFLAVFHGRMLLFRAGGSFVEEKSKRVTLLPILLLVVASLALGGLGWLLIARAPSTETAAVVAAPTSLATQAPPVPAVLAGIGTIQGVVRLAGTAPEMPLLKRGADPVCSAAPMRDREVVVSGDKLANVVVRVANKVPAQNASGAVVEVDQKDCMYSPRVVAVASGGRIQVANGDKTLHNIHAYLGTKTLFNRAQPPGSPPVEYTPTEGGALLVFKCDVHPWMKGYVYVNQNALVGVTDENGRFELTSVPAGGPYTLEAWHERYGTKTMQVTVPADGSATADFTYGP